MILTFVLNGKQTRVDTAPDRRAVDLLREDLGLLGTKEGCGTGDCGACSVLLDGELVLSCLLLAAQLEGREVTTVEGLGTPENPHPIQEAFAALGAVQCGFCTPGMILATAALLRKNPRPTREEARQALSGNLCRCTGYARIVDAVLAAARAMRRKP